MNHVHDRRIVEVFTNGNAHSRRLLDRLFRIPVRNCLVIVRRGDQREPELRIDGQTMPDEDTTAISLALGVAGSCHW